MAQVASEATSSAFKPAPPALLRPAPSAEGAPDLPFESLLDTDTQAAPPPPPQAPQAPQQPQSPQSPKTPQTAADKAAENTNRGPAAKTDGKTTEKISSKPESKTTGKTAAKATGKVGNPAQPLPAAPPVDPNGGETVNTTGKVAIATGPDDNKAAQAAIQTRVQLVVQAVDDSKASDAADTIAAAVTPLTPKTPGDAKAKADGKLGEITKAADTSKSADDKQTADAKAAGDAKPSTSPVPAIVAADPTVPPLQTATPAAPVQTTPEHAAVIAPVTAEVSQVGPLAKQTATVAPKPTAAPKAKAGEFAALQDGVDKAATARTHDDAPAAAPHIAADKPALVATDAQAALPKTAGDAVQQSSPPAPTPDMVPAATPPAAPTAPAAPAPLAAQAAPVPIAGVAIEIATQAQAGKNHFEIRLDPPELGRIEVRLDVDRDGHVTSRLIADRSDTLNLLRNDASGLQRALQDAGLKTSDSGMQFSLRDQSMNQQHNATPGTPNTAQIVVQDSTLPAGEVTQRNYSRLAGLRGGIDIRV